MEIVDGVNVDFDATGGIVGFDIDHASRHLDVSTLEAEAPGILQRVSDRRHPEAVHVETGKDFLRVFLADGRGIAVPLSWYPRLCHGTAEEAQKWELRGEGESIFWPALDERMGVSDLLKETPSGSHPSSLGFQTKRMFRMRVTRKRYTLKQAKISALREIVGLWSGWLVVGFMLGGVLGAA